MRDGGRRRRGLVLAVVLAAAVGMMVLTAMVGTRRVDAMAADVRADLEAVARSHASGADLLAEEALSGPVPYDVHHSEGVTVLRQEVRSLGVARCVAVRLDAQGDVASTVHDQRC